MGNTEFIDEKITAMRKISSCIVNKELKLGLNRDDFLEELLTAVLSAHIYSNMAEQRELVYSFKRPTFWEWITRKKRKATFTLNVKDLLINPPKNTDNVIRIYEVKNN